MRLTDLFIRRPVLSQVLSLCILLLGIGAILALPIREYPELESATIQVETRLPGATQDIMQGFVTAPIAQAIATANGIDYLTSSSSQGVSVLRAKLALNADDERALTEILGKIQQVRYRIPQGATDPVVTKQTDGASAVQYVAFVSDTLSVPQLTDFVARAAQPRITAIPGVASADVSGGQALAMRIWVDPDRLAARGLSAGDLAAALRANNVQAAPGQLKGAMTATDITVSTDLRGIEEFRNIVLRSGASGLVRLRDVATVEFGGQNYDTSTLTNGHRSVTVAIYPTPEANPLEIVRAAQALIPELQRLAPPGVRVMDQFNVAHFVDAAMAEVLRTLVESIVIVMAVVFLFLGSARGVLVPLVTIPLSLIGTAALMYLFGFSINLLTLLAMVLAIGLVVDDAIVVVENIHRHVERGTAPFEAALIGAREIVGPVIAMTVTLAVVYAPVALMGGLTGALFREFAFALAGSVIVSGVIALTLSPMMSARLLRPGRTGGPAGAGERAMARVAGAYGRLTDRILGSGPAVAIAFVAVVAASALFFTSARRELAPPEDHGYVFVFAKGPQYANIDYSTRFAREIDRVFHRLPEYVSSWFDNGIDGANASFGGVILKDWAARSRGAGEIQSQIAADSAGVTGVYAAVFQPAPLPAASGGLPVQMVVRTSDDFRALYDTVERLKGAAWGSGLFLFVDSDLAFDSPQARIVVDRARAGQMGVSMESIASTLALLVGENYVDRFNWHDRAYDVITQVPAADRLDPGNLARYSVKTDKGALVQLSSVVRIETRPQANSLHQFNQLNAATLSAVLAPGKTMGQAVDFLKSQPLPAGTSVDWLSDSRQYVVEGDRLTLAFGIALLVIFLALAALFESWRDSLVILATVPLAIGGALLPLYLGFATLNIYTQIGLVTLIALISKHGILMVAFANDLCRQRGLTRREAIRDAAAVRMRPVLMTTAAMVAGMLPLVFADGAGAAGRFSLGVVMVTGMVIGTGFTLFVLPSIYLFAAPRRGRRTAGMPAYA